VFAAKENSKIKKERKKENKKESREQNLEQLEIVHINRCE
jgi:hypothetical protein